MELTTVGEMIRGMKVEGNEPPWELFVGRFGWRLAERVSRILEERGALSLPEDVEDLVQEIYCRLLDHRRRRLHDFRGTDEREVMSFLCRIARTVVTDHLRARGAGKRGAALVVKPRTSQGGLPRSAADPGPSPEERTLLQDARRRFLRRCREVAGSRAPRRVIAVLRLALLEGWSSREIAASMAWKLSPSGVDSIICRARRRLAAMGVPLPPRERSLLPEVS